MTKNIKKITQITIISAVKKYEMFDTVMIMSLEKTT
tara:strand:- start:966 stop:1073 length:108 start_codon:yes stop_codon:yes gene_type:complete